MQKKSRKIITHNLDKNRSIGIGREIILMIELVDKDIKTAIINRLHMFKK